MSPFSPLLRPTPHTLRCMSLSVMAAASLACHAAPANNINIFGQWRVVSVLDTAEITGISEQKARSLIGKKLDIDASGFRFQNTVCKTPSYQRAEQETARYLRVSWHARSGNLGLPDRVTVVDAHCTDIFIKSDKRVIFNWQGYFLEAARMAAAQTSEIPPK